MGARKRSKCASHVWLHGFGLGTGAVAEGWFNLAVDFWEKNR